MKALVIDLGRSVVRYGLVSEEDQLVSYASMPTPKAPFVEIVAEILNRLGVQLRGMALGVAAPGPFYGPDYEPLNMEMGVFSADDLTDRYQPSRLVVIHDVIGGALGASLVPEGERRWLVDVSASARVPARSPHAFVQTGVGLGVAALLPVRAEDWLPISGEGGSAQVAPCTTDEEIVFQSFQRDPGMWEAATAQALLSTASLHQYGAALNAGFEDADAITIVRQARTGDAAAERILATYAGFLGSFAASVALTFRSYAGVTIAGYLPSALPTQARETFVTRFRERGTVKPQLKRIPVDLIEDEYLALVGLSSILAEER